MNSNYTKNLTENLYNDTLNSTISIIDNENDFIDVITSPCFYGGIIIFVFLLLCIITFIFILKSRKNVFFFKIFFINSKACMNL